MLCNNFPVCNGNKPTNFVDMVAKEMGGCGKEIAKELQFSGMQAVRQSAGGSVIVLFMDVKVRHYSGCQSIPITYSYYCMDIGV